MNLYTLKINKKELTPQALFVIKCTPEEELRELFWDCKNIGDVNEYCEFLAREYPHLYAMDDD